MREETVKKIRELAAEYEKDLIAYRRRIHENPELGNQEYETAEFIVSVLKEAGVDTIYEHCAGGTGVLGIICGKQDGPTVGLRCDIDALPVKEETGLPFASKKTMHWGDQGEVPVMHACGHDIHTAILLITARVLCQMREQLKGRVVLIFQPAEEGCSSDWVGASGALRFTQDEKYKENHPDVVFGLHNNPYCPNGSAGVCGTKSGVLGYYMDILRITVKGQGCHGSTPWNGKDSIMAAASILMNLQTLVTKDANVNEDHVTVTMGAIRGGSKFNVVAETTVIDGAIRFTNLCERELLERRFREIVEFTAQAHGCTAEVSYTWIPANYNDPVLVEKMTPVCKQVLGENYQEKGYQFDPLDDFSWFTEEVPGIFFGLSSAGDDGDNVGKLHEATYHPNERGFVEGVKLLAACALGYAD